MLIATQTSRECQAKKEVILVWKQVINRLLAEFLLNQKQVKDKKLFTNWNKAKKQIKLVFQVTKELDKMDLDDNKKADLCFIVTVLVFFVLTFIAFLMTEGRVLVVYPVIRKIHPNANCLKNHDLEQKQRTQNLYAFKDCAFGRKKIMTVVSENDTETSL